MENFFCGYPNKVHGHRWKIALHPFTSLRKSRNIFINKSSVKANQRVAKKIATRSLAYRVRFDNERLARQKLSYSFETERTEVDGRAHQLVFWTWQGRTPTIITALLSPMRPPTLYTRGDVSSELVERDTNRDDLPDSNHVTPHGEAIYETKKTFGETQRSPETGAKGDGEDAMQCHTHHTHPSLTTRQRWYSTNYTVDCPPPPRLKAVLTTIKKK